MEEKEVKFLDIDPVEMENKLKNIGAKKVFDKIYRRRVFDYPDLRLHKNSSWVRLRDEGDKVTLAFKHRLGAKGSDGKVNDEGMEEIEVIVSDFEKTAKILERIGLKEKFYEENRRIRYVKDGVEFDIDFWPGIKPYLEIEAETWEKIDQAIEEFGLDPKDKKIFSTYQIYKLNGINEDDYKIITFEKMVKKSLAIVCFKKIGRAWFGVALDESRRVLTCSFSLQSREDIVKNILNELPSNTVFSEKADDAYCLSILESLNLIFKGKEPKVKPQLAWNNIPPFYRKVLKLTAQIPKGKVMTYGGISAEIGQPNGTRAVGNAEASNPFAPIVPCHRVISSSLKLGGYGSGLDVKKEFLIREGVVFENDRVSEKCVWRVLYKE